MEINIEYDRNKLYLQDKNAVFQQSPFSNNKNKMTKRKEETTYTKNKGFSRLTCNLSMGIQKKTSFQAEINIRNTAQ